MKNFLKKTKQLLSLFLGHTGFLYLAAFLLSLPFAKYDAAFLGAQASTLNRLRPNFQYLLALRDGEAVNDKIKMREYLEYFRKVDRYIPNKPDAQAILGYCTYYNGQEKESLHFFKKALEGYSSSLSINYNLGALSFKKGEYQKAKSYFLTALSSNPNTDLLFISSSRIYFPLIRDPKNIRTELQEYLLLGRERCYRLLILTCEALKNYPEMLAFATQAAASDFKDKDFFLIKEGIAAYQLGYYAQAAVLLQRVLHKTPPDAPALNYLGLALQALNQNPAAGEILRQAEIIKESEKEKKPKKEEIVLQLY